MHGEDVLRHGGRVFPQLLVLTRLFGRRESDRSGITVIKTVILSAEIVNKTIMNQNLSQELLPRWAILAHKS